MTINQKLKAALEPIVPVVEPDCYKGDAPEYMVFRYSELPFGFADDVPQAILCQIQIHWFLPHGGDPVARKRRIAAALFAAGFTYPEVANASDEAGQHYIFACEMEEETGLGAD